MISQSIKDIYYASFGKLSAVSLFLSRLRSPTRFRDAFVNIGCGRNYVPGMINVDGNIARKKDLWLDVRLGLPFPDNSVRGIYSSHMIEHLNLRNVRKLFTEFHRALKPGGRVRLVVPSLEYAIEAYLQRNGDGLPDWPEAFESPGGKFNNLMLCANQHLILFDFSLLQELLLASRFSSVIREAPLSSSYFMAGHLKFESDPALIGRSLHVEAIK
jgi:predicted SAM-dependent methyltransferase